jgi:nitrate/nitrite transport system substrate-binding protein
MRAMSDPVPWQSMAVWMFTQMKRWGYTGNVDYKSWPKKCFCSPMPSGKMSLSGAHPTVLTNASKSWARSSTRTARCVYVNSFSIRKLA